VAEACQNLNPSPGGEGRKKGRISFRGERILTNIVKEKKNLEGPKAGAGPTV